MKSIVGIWMICFAFIQVGIAQVDTTYVFRTGMPYGTLDIRLAKSAVRYYYLDEGKTFSFRESAPGVKTNTYKDLTSWDSSPYTQGSLREKNGNTDAFIMNYRLLFPANYDPNFAEGYPLIVMTHGAGERGNCWEGGCYWSDDAWRPSSNTPAAPTTATHDLLNNDHNLLHGGEVHLRARNLAGNKLPNDPTLAPRAFPGFVLFPQNLNGWDANNSQDAIRLIRLIMKKYKIDQNKIYVHGLSQGGYGTFEVIKRAPWLFAAALPMSAVSDAGITGASYASVLEDMSHIPLWIFQGGIDTNPTPTKTRAYVKRFRNGGVVVRYSEYAHLGHGVWNTAYDEPDFFSWMLSKNKANIHVFGGIAAVCKTNGQGAKMALAKGFMAYQWEKDGAIIPDANGPIFTASEPGVYRARFSRVANPTEEQWNRWSAPVTIIESNPPQAKMEQTGTVVLKDLNNYNDVKLNAIGDFAHYYWYKDGVLLDLYGNEDDTTQHPVFKQGTCTNLPACAGNGLYTLVTAGLDNCPSPPSEGKQIYFNNQAPVTITAPTAFTGSATSPSGASLRWNDISENEGGFEIWRRKITGTNTYSRWAMATLTSANITSFTDSRLEPSSTYQYKIRAVGNVGRSDYTPMASNQFLIITTQADDVLPTTPMNLQASETGIKEITLNWEASTDNTGVRYYEIILKEDSIVVTPNALNVYTLKGLKLNKKYTIAVRAVDLGGNKSNVSNGVNASTFLNGLYYKHSTGGWNDLDVIDWNIAEFTGKVPDITLTPRTQEDYFNFEFNGYLYISTGGVYQFRTTSDDGSRLTLNDSVIVNNDGLHGDVTITSTNLNLSPGPQLFNVKYFEYTGGNTLTVQYKGPDSKNNWITIPAPAYRSGIAETIPPTVIITTPVNNASFITGSSVTINATATDPDGSVSKVEFFEGATKLGEDTSSPYSFTWINVPSGSYSLTAKAIDDSGTTGTSSAINITVVNNTPPVVSITSPANNASFTAPTSVIINASASDADGSVSKVEFFQGTTKLGEDVSSPYTFTWANVSAGSYSLTAKATDNNGTATTSSVINITVSNTPPVASITSPANNASFTAPASITINASASDANGSVSKVEFFQGTTKLGEDTSSPYTFIWTDVSAGSYSLTAKATDNNGAITTSSVINITVGNSNPPPIVSITSPDNNAGFTAPASITINVNASDPGESVAKVEFFNGATKLGEDTSSPYSFNWTNVSAGSYQLTAKATDNRGLTSTSAIVNVTVSSSNPTISIYPNPAPPNSSITVTGSGMGTQSVRVRLTSLLGETYYDNTFSASTFTQGVSITPTKRMYAGVYIITVQQGSTVIRELILIRN
ncbi:Ig-like domain-containing protein [Chryseosolibacter indicus]|uniref:Fibronectin type III domain-containing protein n=1 Tax=Chryseosolibacter indicus TaxID=2782351 RepID=A0ABS5VN81_9BACT|nr:Ig-like domain-containing protein [Chryseosolibacter indicus]MBT1702581.1 fibronectin type III domain-containing protein [Chryseosolibacter indicus]